MDINTALMTGAGTILCGVLVAIIFIFGFKEKTFEEALDEQRRGELLDLIRGDKARTKKPKKIGKKTKEKLATNDGKQTKEVPRHNEPATAEPEKPSHVEFKFPEAEVVSERPLAPPPQEDIKKKKNKRDKVKPILHNKEEHSPLAANVDEPPPANHFDETHPKDDVLLKRSHSREDINGPSSEEPILEPDEVVPPRGVKHEKAAPISKTTAPATKANGTKPAAGKVALNSDAKVAVGKLALSTPVAPVAQIPIAAPALVAVNIATQNAAPPAPVITSVIAKDRKKKKGEFASLQQMISKENEGITMSLLLPLVRKAELSRSEVHQLIEQLLNREQGGGTEWVEGRQDPVSRLKKQLAEKEKALAEEQEGAQAVQAKLLQVRAELNVERQRQGTIQRQFDEQLNAKQNELQTITARLQLANETHNKTMATAQQVQTQLAEEKKKVRKLMEEQAAAQALNNVSQEQELRLQTTIKLHQEEMSTLQGQMAGLQNQLADLKARLQEQQSSRDELLGEMTGTKEAMRSRELEVEHLNQQLAEIEAQLQQANILTSEKDVELDEAYHAQEELEKRLQSLDAELENSQKEVEDLHAQLQSAQSMPPPVHPSPDVPDLSGKVSNLEEIISTKDALVAKLQAENEEQKKAVSQLQSELDSQREKNNELRVKNWKAMEAVSSAEKNLEAKQKECERLATNSSTTARQEEQAALRELLQRIFPSVPCPDTKDHKAWVSKFENAAQQWLSSELSAISEQQQQQQQQSLVSGAQDESTQHVLDEVEKQNSQLQAMVTHYKSIIEDTEGMLNKLERHVEQEEARWRRQLQIKEEELVSVTTERDTLRSELQQGDQQQQQTSNTEELEAALTVLRGKLQSEEDQRRVSETRAQQLQSRLDEIAVEVTVLKQAKEERDALAMQLAKESSHSQQLAQQVKELEAVAQRAGTNHFDPNKSKDQSNATTNGPSTEPSISESRPVKRRRLTEWFRKKVSHRKRRSPVSAPESFKQSRQQDQPIG